MLALCVTLSEGMWLVSVGITAFLEPGKNTQDHRFQQPKLWASNRVIAMTRGFLFVFWVSLKVYQAGEVISLIICVYITFRRNWGTDSGPQGSQNGHTGLYDKVGTCASCSWEHAFDCCVPFLSSVPCQDTSHPAMQHPGVSAAPGPPVSDGATQQSHCPWRWLAALWGSLSKMWLCAASTRYCTVSKE